MRNTEPNPNGNKILRRGSQTPQTFTLTDIAIEKLGLHLGVGTCAYAVANGDGGWSRRHKLLTWDRFAQHVRTGRPLCVSMCRFDPQRNEYLHYQKFAVFDIDSDEPAEFPNATRTALAIGKAARRHNATPMATFSGKKGWHIWCTFDQEMFDESVAEWQAIVTKEALEGLSEEGSVAFEFAKNKFFETREMPADERHRETWYEPVNGVHVDFLIAGGQGKVVKIPFSRHQHPLRDLFFEIPVKDADIEGFDREIPPTDEQFQNAMRALMNFTITRAETIEQELAATVEGGSRLGTTRIRSRVRTSSSTLPPFEIPESAGRQDEIWAKIQDTPCLKKCYEDATTLPGQYWTRVNLVTTLSASGFNREEIAVFIRDRINDALDNRNLGINAYQVNYWFPKTYLSKCEKFQDQGNERFCCPGVCGRQRPSDMAPIKPIDEAVRDIIESGHDTIVRKTTRAGMTTNMVMECAKSGRKLCVVVPTTKIATDTFAEAMRMLHEQGINVNGAVLGDNRISCLKLRIKGQEIRETHDVGRSAWDELPFVAKPSCSDCKYNQREHFFNFNPLMPVFESSIDNKQCAQATIREKIDDIDILFLSYAKLQAMINSLAEVTVEIMEKISHYDVFMLDEVSHITDTAAVDVRFQQITVTNVQIYNYLLTLKRQMEDLQLWNDNKMIDAMFDMTEKMDNKLHGLITMQNTIGSALGEIENDIKIVQNTLDEDEQIEMSLSFVAKYNQIVLFAIENNRALDALADMLRLMRFPEWIFSNVPNLDYKVNTSLKVRPETKDVADYLTGADAQVVVTDATMPLADLSRVFFREFEDTNIGDPRKTAEKMKYIPDTRHIAATKLFAQEDEARLYGFLDNCVRRFGLENMVVVAPSIRHKKRLQTWFIDQFHGVPYLLTYHRSSHTVGVRCDKRIMINLCAPFPPESAYGWLTHVYPELGDLGEDALRKYDASKTYYQTTSRVKDPMATERSVVLNYGMSYGDVAGLLSDCNSAPKTAYVQRDRGMDDDAVPMPILLADVWMTKGLILTAIEQRILRKAMTGATAGQIYQEIHRRAPLSVITEICEIVGEINDR